MPRRVLMIALLAVYTLISAAGLAGPAQAQAGDSLGQVTLRWTMTVQGSDTGNKDYRTDWPEDWEWETEEWNEQLTLVYHGVWTWQVTRDEAGSLELDQGEGQYNVSGSGGGSMQVEGWEGPKAVYCTQGRGGYWVPSSYHQSYQWSYQAKPGPGGRVYATLYRQGSEMGYRVSWDWDQEITIDGTGTESRQGCTSSTASESCGTSTVYGTCPGAGGAELQCTLFVLGQATPAWESEGVLHGKVRPEEWGFSVSGRGTYSPEPMVENQTGKEYRSTRTLQGSAVLEYTLTYEREPSDLEAVIVVPGEGEYEQWQPWAGDNEDEVGSQLRVEAELRYKDRPEATPFEKATFDFRLINTSREPGICPNAPAKDKAKDTPDLKIDQDCNPDLQVDKDGQSASSIEPAQGAGVTISCYDWGAYGQLQVTATTEDGRVLVAHLEGQPEKETLTIPRDENDNHIADSWEENEGVLSQNLPADWNGSPIPRGQWSDGDGISLYEKYRGFEFGSGDNVHHERLVALAKHIFVYDPDGIVLQTMVDPRGAESSLPKVSQCRVRFVDDRHWTGAGAAGNDKRIVNFNTSGFGHFVDQHALDVRVDDSEAPTVLPEWKEQYRKATGKEYNGEVENARGITYFDPSLGTGNISPARTFRIVIYPNNIALGIRQAVIHNTKGLPEFASATNNDLQREADRYINAHAADYGQLEAQQKARVVSHEAGHGLGVKHHDPLVSGEKACVMRYQSMRDCARNPDDRFELACRVPWPNTFCTGGAGCWEQVQVTDR